METSFHPKAYLFDYDNGKGLLIVGSSNFSISAMRMGMEWNLAMNARYFYGNKHSFYSFDPSIRLIDCGSRWYIASIDYASHAPI